MQKLLIPELNKANVRELTVQDMFLQQSISDEIIPKLENVQEVTMLKDLIQYQREQIKILKKLQECETQQEEKSPEGKIKRKKRSHLFKVYHNTIQVTKLTQPIISFLQLCDRHFCSILKPYTVYPNPILEQDTVNLVLNYYSLDNQFGEHIHRKLCNLYAVLAVGAYFSGHYSYSEEFASRARHSFIQITDTSHYEVSCAINIMTYYWIMVHNDIKAGYYNSILMSICNKKTTKSVQMVDVEILGLYFRSLLHPSKLLEVYEQLLKINTPRSLIFASIVFAESFLEQPTLQHAIYIKQCGTVEEQLQKVPNFLQVSDTMSNPLFQMCMQSFSFGYLAHSHLKKNNKPLAKQYADKATVILNNIYELQHHQLVYCQYKFAQVPFIVHASLDSTEFIDSELAILDVAKAKGHIFTGDAAHFYEKIHNSQQ